MYNYYELKTKDHTIRTFKGVDEQQASDAFRAWYGYWPLGVYRVLSEEEYNAEWERFANQVETTPSRDGWTGD